MPPKVRIKEFKSALSATERVKGGPRRTLWLASRYHILINTNHAFKSQERMFACMEALRKATQDLPPEVYAIREWDMLYFFEWLAFGKKSRQPMKENYHQLYDTAIEKIKLLYVFEKGPINDFLHEHIDIQINHQSCIQFNHKVVYAYFKDALKDFPEITSLFIRIKRVKAFMSNAYFKKSLMVAEGFDLSDSAKRAVHNFMDTYPGLEVFEENAVEIPNRQIVR